MSAAHAFMFSERRKVRFMVEILLQEVGKIPTILILILIKSLSVFTENHMQVKRL